MENKIPYTSDLVLSKSCENFRDCAESCCLEYDPGLVKLETLNTAKFPTTKSNVCSNIATLSKFTNNPSKETPGIIDFDNGNRVTVKCKDPTPNTCEVDSDCPEKYFKGGCCMMVDPGSISADLLKGAGFVTTKSKMCADASFKMSLDEMKKAGIDSLPLSGTNEKLKVYCDGTAVPPFSCTTDSNCDAE